MATSQQNQNSQDDDKAASDLAAQKIPYSFAKRHGVVIERVDTDKAYIAHRPGLNAKTLLELRRKTKRALTFNALDEESFNALLARSYEGSTHQAMDIISDLDNHEDLKSLVDALPEPEDLMESEDDAPVIRLINAILSEAINKDASDIHVEPFEQRLSIRFRVDGVMQEMLEPPRQMAPLLISRIKVMAKLDIAEKRLPQDGRMSLRLAGRPVDVRVSTLPSGHGERIVLRLLDKQAGNLDIDQLGMASAAREQLTSMLKLPHGIVLVTGPTGAGKTTTLYAALTRLNTRRSTILTVEDPIEYYIDGIGQTQVNNKVNLTFARGLRAVLRQDPDIVMVGEIRDLETAEIAVQASLTGHLVLSTLHTNSAVGAVTRLRDMGIEAFLLSSSLVGVVAQRLVRVLCQDCKTSYLPNQAECDAIRISVKQLPDGELDPDSVPLIYGPQGCESCSHTGFTGRTGVYEVTPIDETLRNMIHDGSSEYELENHARTISAGIADDGRRLVLDGITSIEEVLRVTREV